MAKMSPALSWEDALLRDTPRGIPGHEPRVPSAHWMQELGPEWEYHRKAVFLGYRDGQGIGVADDRHVTLCCGSRGGKTVSYTIPNCLLYEGNILAIDPKGELANKTAKRRAEMGQRVIVIDPFPGAEKLPRVCEVGLIR